jgi:hypothetical protein
MVPWLITTSGWPGVAVHVAAAGVHVVPVPVLAAGAAVCAVIGGGGVWVTARRPGPGRRTPTP